MSASNSPSFQPSSSSNQISDLEADWHLIKPPSDKPRRNTDTPPGISSIFGAIDETKSGHNKAEVRQWNLTELRPLTKRDLDINLLLYVTKRIFHKDDIPKNVGSGDYYLNQIDDYGIVLGVSENRITNCLKNCDKTTISFHHFLPKEERRLVENHIYNIINTKTLRAFYTYKSNQNNCLIKVVNTISIEYFSSRELSDLSKTERAIVIFSNAALYLRIANSLPLINKKLNLYKAAIELKNFINGRAINSATQIPGLEAIGQKSNVLEIWVRSTIEHSILRSLNAFGTDDYVLPFYNGGTSDLILKVNIKNVNLSKINKSYFFYLKKFFPDQANRITETFLARVESPLKTYIKSQRIKTNKDLSTATGRCYNELSEITTSVQLFNSCGVFENLLRLCDLQEHYLEWKGMTAKPQRVQPLERDALE